jgi:hypothetical protein
MWERGREGQVFPTMSSGVTTAEMAPVMDGANAKVLRVSRTLRPSIYAISWAAPISRRRMRWQRGFHA